MNGVNTLILELCKFIFVSFKSKNIHFSFMPLNRSPFKCASSVVTKFASSNRLLPLCNKSSLTFATNKGQQALVKQYDQGSASFCGGTGEGKAVSFISF